MNISPLYQTRVVGEIPINEVHQGICPEGWHIPTLDEWGALFDYVKSTYGENEHTAVLKSSESWIWYSTKYIPSNKTGFSVLATGIEYEATSLASIGGATSFISATYSGITYLRDVFRFNVQEHGYGGTHHINPSHIRCVENAAP